MAPLLSIGHLCHEVREIILGLHMGRQYLTYRNNLADSVVANGHSSFSMLILAVECYG